jgi:hypothetical protein
MRSQQPCPESLDGTDPSMDARDRTDLDEALFAGETPFTLAGTPVVPVEVAQNNLQRDEPVPLGPDSGITAFGVPLEMPPSFTYRTPDEDSPGPLPTVINGGNYELANMGPGVFEVRQRPAPAEIAPGAGVEERTNGEVPLDSSLPVETKIEEPAEAGVPRVEQETPEPSRAARETEVCLDPLPPRPVPVLAVATGLTLAAGETVGITPAHLRLTGGEAVLLEMMILSPPLHGALVRDGFALTGGDVFTQDDIDQNRLHYRHEGGNDLADSFTFATPEGEVPATVFPLTIEPVRFAPEVTGNGQLAAILAGVGVKEILEGTVRCCAPARQPGLAIVGVTGKGQWQYSLDAGSTWLTLGTVNHGHALLLGAEDSLRFVPRAGRSGAIEITYHAWDQSTGESGALVNLSPRNATGETTAFSKTTAVARTTVSAPPPAPAPTLRICPEPAAEPAAEPVQATMPSAALPLSDQTDGAPREQAPALDPTITPWTSTPTMGDLVGGALAVVRVEGEGTWQYSLDDGRTWLDFGAVYHGRARLLRPGDRVRFLPRRGATGKVLLSGRPWTGAGAESGETLSLAAKRTYGDRTPFAASLWKRTWRLEER